MSQSAPTEAPDTTGAALLADALAGLTAPRKTLPCKWLYDQEGARLFEAITRLPEYYPTRTEAALLPQVAPAVATAVGPRAVVVELGSGDGEKVSHILRALDRPQAYVPVDIAPEWLAEAAGKVAERHPGLAVVPLVADFTRPFALPSSLRGGPMLGFFPGSTIGNFEPAEATALLRRLRTTLGAGSKLLLGADLVKDQAVLEAAYDDAAGVTAAFNLNLLRRLNREAGAEFDLAGFRHQAVWNARLERIEMHLVSVRQQVVRLAGRSISFQEGETIQTESSHKYTPDRMRALAQAGGWQAARMWTDAGDLFSVWLLDAV